jgi:toxin ParE1/3/4
MSVIRRSKRSDQDYFDIWRHIAFEGNPDAADSLLRKFDHALALLADYPYAGPARPELQSRLRSYPVGNYLLLYRPVPGGVELARVVHGSRDVKRALRHRR